MYRRTLLTALFAACLLVPALAAEKDAEKEDPNAAALCRAVEQIAMGHSSLAYGREHKTPEALLTAVDVFLRFPTQEFKPKLEGEGAELLPAPDMVKELAGILNEARQMRPDDKDLAGLTRRLEERLKDKPRAALQPRSFGATVPSGGLTFGALFSAGPGSASVSGPQGRVFTITARDNSGRVVGTGGGNGTATVNFRLTRQDGVSFNVRAQPITLRELVPVRVTIR